MEKKRGGREFGIFEREERDGEFSIGEEKRDDPIVLENPTPSFFYFLYILLLLLVKLSFYYDFLPQFAYLDESYNSGCYSSTLLKGNFVHEIYVLDSKRYGYCCRIASSGSQVASSIL